MTRLIVHSFVNVQAVICDQNFQPVPHRKHHMASETRNIEHTDYFYHVFLSVISFHTMKLVSLYEREQLNKLIFYV